MNCRRLIKKDGTIIKDVIVRESKEFKGFIEIENEQGKINVIPKESIENMVKDTDHEEFVCQVI